MLSQPATVLIVSFTIAFTLYEMPLYITNLQSDRLMVLVVGVGQGVQPLMISKGIVWL